MGNPIPPTVLLHHLRPASISFGSQATLLRHLAVVSHSVCMHLLLSWSQPTLLQILRSIPQLQDQHVRIDHLLHPDPSPFGHNPRSRDQLALLEQTQSPALIRDVAPRYRVAQVERRGFGGA